MDLYVEAQLKSLNKQRRALPGASGSRRERRKKREERFENKSFEEQVKERDQMKEQAQKKKTINELIMTIKALELIGIDTSKERETLKQLLFSSK